MRLKSRSLSMAALGLVLVLAAAACSTGNTYDASKIEAYLSTSQKSTLKGLKEGAATCPDGLTLKEGMTFTCTLVIGDATAPYTVTLTQVDKHPSHIAVKPTKAILSVAELEAFVTKNLQASADGAKVTCGTAGKQVILATAGQKITCALKLGSQTGSVELTVKDAKGDVVISGST